MWAIGVICICYRWWWWRSVVCDAVVVVLVHSWWWWWYLRGVVVAPWSGRGRTVHLDVGREGVGLNGLNSPPVHAIIVCKGQCFLNNAHGVWGSWRSIGNTDFSSTVRALGVLSTVRAHGVGGTRRARESPGWEPVGIITLHVEKKRAHSLIEKNRANKS